VLSADPQADPALLSILGASVALQLSDIPWNGPIIGVRAALLQDKLVLFPSLTTLDQAKLNLMVTLGENGLVMVEGGAREVSEAELVEALILAQEATQKPLQEIKKWCQDLCPGKRSLAEAEPEDKELVQQIQDLVEQPLRSLFGTKMTKLKRKSHYHALIEKAIQHCGNETAERSGAIKNIIEQKYHQLLRELTLEKGYRLDSRKYTEIRPITCEVGWLPRTHGSAIFTRGETQALVSCSLGTSRDEQIVETLYGVEKHRFMLHYNFPPFSVGEVRPQRGPGRREIGHGALAARALEPLLPPHNNFPYTVRIVSDIAESNGSSSMATVCGACLSLLDAGVPITQPVAGIAMGLIKRGDDIVILSDILGDEDHFGDMDFKVAGTEYGITAVQMDNKLGALKKEILEDALAQALRGRLHILAEMRKVIQTDQVEISPRAPRVLTLKIRQNKIRDLIGPGGKHIQEIQADTKTRIEVDDAGRVNIYAENLQGAQIAMNRVKQLTEEPEVGKVYQGVVVSVKHFGVFVKIFANTEGLVHISELDIPAAKKIEEVYHSNDAITVRVQGVDEKGRIKLSQKAARS
ncbi:polyribonucleotide nucleotidyltransferase, partial [candidate division CSSED10-310 bacterium]